MRYPVRMNSPNSPLVNILMGSQSDWPVMEKAANTLRELGVPYEARVLSAHRTPHETAAYIEGAAARGVRVIIAAAGAAAHLAGVCAAHTVLPVLGVPMTSKLDGLDSLLSTVQMPAGVPVGTLAIGEAGATNAALLAAQIIALSDDGLAKRLRARRDDAAKKILATRLEG